MLLILKQPKYQEAISKMFPQSHIVEVHQSASVLKVASGVLFCAEGKTVRLLIPMFRTELPIKLATFIPEDADYKYTPHKWPPNQALAISNMGVVSWDGPLLFIHALFEIQDLHSS